MQDATPVVPVPASVHVSFVDENTPDVVAVKLTLPAGVLGDPAVSVTVAVQEVGEPTPTDAGEQLTAVVVASAVATRAEDVPWLIACVPSPK